MDTWLLCFYTSYLSSTVQCRGLPSARVVTWKVGMQLEKISRRVLNLLLFVERAQEVTLFRWAEINRNVKPFYPSYLWNSLLKQRATMVGCV